MRYTNLLTPSPTVANNEAMRPVEKVRKKRLLGWKSVGIGHRILQYIDIIWESLSENFKYKWCRPRNRRNFFWCWIKSCGQLFERVGDEDLHHCTHRNDSKECKLFFARRRTILWVLKAKRNAGSIGLMPANNWHKRKRWGQSTPPT